MLFVLALSTNGAAHTSQGQRPGSGLPLIMGKLLVLCGLHAIDSDFPSRPASLRADSWGMLELSRYSVKRICDSAERSISGPPIGLS